MDDARAVPKETEAARQARLVGEAALIAEAEHELAEGKFITGAQLQSFFAWFVSEEEGPPPGETDAT